MSKHKTSSFVSYLVRNELLRTFTKNLNPLEGGYDITATYITQSILSKLSLQIYFPHRHFSKIRWQKILKANYSHISLPTISINISIFHLFNFYIVAVITKNQQHCCICSYNIIMKRNSFNTPVSGKSIGLCRTFKRQNTEAS